MKLKSNNEKPIITNYINAGIYVLSPDCIESLEFNKYCDMTTLLEKINKNSNSVIIYPMHEPWLDIGRSQDLYEANKIKEV